MTVNPYSHPPGQHPTHSSADMYCRHCLPGYEHITLPEPGVGTRVTVNDDDDIIQVSVNEIQT